MTEFKNVPLADIRPDPNQPRKYYDEMAMQELTDSVREKGVIQPIVIRPNGKGYLVVCGERRYRAAMAVAGAIQTRNEIPAVIRELSDEEALDLQIIENLQRKDVHPMEEAVAFKSLLEKGKPAEEVTARVGKSVFYVRQRMKLNSLSKEWQGLFYSGRLSNVEAMKIGLFDVKVQTELFKEFGNMSGQIAIGDWNMRRYRGDLSKASFDINDSTLDKKMGACIGCQFNSATANLFPDAGKNATCSYIPCFKNKSDINFNKTFESAIADPTVVFLNGDYGERSDDKFVVKAKKEGHKVWSKYSYRVQEKPELESFEEWKENNDDEEQTEKQLLAAYQEDEVIPHEKFLKSYEKNVAGGKYKKALMLTGDNRGRYVFVILGKDDAAKAGSSKSAKEKEAAGTITAAEIDEEIKRIQDRQKRNIELDMEKVHVATLVELEKKPELKQSGHIDPIERSIMIFLLVENAGDYRTRDFLKKNLKSIPETPYGGHNWHTDYFKKLSLVSDADLSLLIRHLAFNKYGNKNTVSGIRPGDTAMRMIADSLKINLRYIELQQEEIAAKRKEKADKRIAALREQKKALVKPTPKKATAKDTAGAAEFVKSRAAKKAVN